MEQVYKGGAQDMGDRLPFSGASLPSSAEQVANAPFNLLLLDSEHFIQWDPPPQQDTSSGGGEKEGHVLVVLLGWLGAPQKHLRKYAKLYRDHGSGSLRFIMPLRQLVWLHFNGGLQRRVANISALIAAWCDADRRRTVLFHTFSQTGWMTYGAVLENLQPRSDIIERIRGIIIDSAPVLELRPEVWAAGFSSGIMKKKTRLTRPPSADSSHGTTLNKVSSVSRPSRGEAFILPILRKFCKILLNVPDVKKRLSKVAALLADKQPSCPQLYLYSSADRVIPAEYVESFISTQISLGLSVSAHNFMSSPHVDHYRSFPHMYSSKLEEFLNTCSQARLRCDG